MWMIDPLIRFYSAMLNIYTRLPQPYLAFICTAIYLGIILIILKCWRWL